MKKYISNEIHVFRKIEHWTLEVDGKCYQLSRDRNEDKIKPVPIDANEWYDIRKKNQIDFERRKVGKTDKTHAEIVDEGEYIWQNFNRDRYKLFTHNCQNFAYMLYERIGVQLVDADHHLYEKIPNPIGHRLADSAEAALASRAVDSVPPTLRSTAASGGITTIEETEAATSGGTGTMDAMSAAPGGTLAAGSTTAGSTIAAESTGTIGAMSEGTIGAMSEGATGAMSEGITGAMSEGITGAMSEEVTGAMSEGIVGAMSEGAATAGAAATVGTAATGGTTVAGSTGTMAAGSTAAGGGTTAAGSTGTMAAGETVTGGTTASGSTAGGGATGHMGFGAKATGLLHGSGHGAALSSKAAAMAPKAAALVHGGHAAAIGAGAAKVGIVAAGTHAAPFVVTGGLLYVAWQGGQSRIWNKKNKKLEDMDVFDKLESENAFLEAAEDPELAAKLAKEVEEDMKDAELKEGMSVPDQAIEEESAKQRLMLEATEITPAHPYIETSSST
ncbi:MAG: hypothetical protein OHK93_001893 [Ramalina farinacea]|uniref:PPPDE domain-containing protein n=1 Tax=Ramalina farinacea TaxID=258253 RepID=A0AA43QS36_9LECA|nr:hypothetical protein [Ramalina farinacea]